MVKLAILASPLVLALAAEWPRTGTIEDVKHIVIFMQENRAFDHYYGTLRGVRGFNDRAAPPLPTGRPVFYQPTNISDRSEYQLPYHVDTFTTSAICMDAPAMGFVPDMNIWNKGNMDAWNTGRDAGYGMSFFDRSDLPYYFALADAFTVGDQYFQSTFTETNPNRLHLFSGSNGLSTGHEPAMSNDEPVPGRNWTTVAEVLEAAGVSWRVYQEADNFDDNGFAWFNTFQQAKPGQPLWDKGQKRVASIVDEFAADIKAGTLPQVSYLVAPTALSEHATNHPADGEDLTARLLKVLQASPATYAKTAFILNYDEGGQFFDHHWTPTPPTNVSGIWDGLSTVDPNGELIPYGLPIGMGFRVPLMVISPWSRGNYVVSQVFDHTSTIQFIEKRFGVHVPNMSPWRRAVAGDLTSAFDFNSFDASWPVLPDTSANVNGSAHQCSALPKPIVPTIQSVPIQEEGTRLARPLPYAFDVTEAVEAATLKLTLTIANTGSQAAAFSLHKHYAANEALDTAWPRKYTVEAHRSLTDAFLADATTGAYAWSLHGPNGFVRLYAGNMRAGGLTTAAPTAALSAAGVDVTGAVTLTLTNGQAAATPCEFVVVDNAYGLGGPWALSAAPGASLTHTVSLVTTGSWYDFSVTGCDGGGGYLRRFMGHAETGKVTTTDPAMTNHFVAFAEPAVHPVTPVHLRMLAPVNVDAMPTHKDAAFLVHASDEL